MKKKVDFVVGKKYRGYGYVNEFGEFEFTPEDTGSRLGAIKRVFSGEGWVMSESKNHYLFNIKIKKSASRLEIIGSFFKVVDTIMRKIRSYEI